ncbi:FtsQ-type POTRA domain-containing protein [Gammaproteobacteria bacterium]|nr:FtsQ-type POTRA domain-containing protein [Gammaproteobacteria bacterium]
MKRAFIFLSLFTLLISAYNYPIFFGTNPVKHILKEGIFEYSDQSRIDDILKNYFSKEIYEIDLRKLKNDIEEDPWVKNAQIILDPPNRIMVKIAEFEPLFLWNNLSYVDKEGFTIKTGQNFIKNILEISSGQANRVYMYNLYLSLQKILSKADINIIKLSKDNDMLIILTSKYRFFVRYTDYELKLQEFLSVYDQFLLTQESKKTRKNIDLRYPTGFAVQ